MVFLVVLWATAAMSVGIGSRRDFAGLEQRRRKAARLFAKGKSQAEVARELEVSRQRAASPRPAVQAGCRS